MNAEQKIQFQNSKGDKLAAILSNPTGDMTKPIVVMAHGFASNKNSRSNTKLVERFDQLGIASFRFDIWGHGESEGNFEDITITEAVDDILQAIKFLKSLDYSRIALVGSSFGGAAAMEVASQTTNLFALALKSPVSDYAEEQLHVRGQEGIDAWKSDGFTLYESNRGGKIKINYTLYEDFLHHSGYQVAPNISIPTLIVHGDQDEEVPVAQSIKTSKLIPNCKLVIVEGAKHSYQEGRHENEMLEAITGFIEEIAKTL